MQAAILTIGSELTTGTTVNTNATYLARRLAEIGIACRSILTIPDEPSRVVQAIRETMGQAPCLLLTGGLGPTCDDVTMAALAEATERPLRYVPAAARSVRRFYTTHRRTLQTAALRQALLPRGGLPLPNPLGTAPGVWLALRSHTIVALPGVPTEMRAIMETSVLPRLRALSQHPPTHTFTFRTVGIVELELQRLLQRLGVPPTVSVGFYPNLCLVDIRLTTEKNDRQLHRLASALRTHLGSAVYGTGEETLEGVVGALLVKRRQTVGIAESCTGGLVSHLLTNVPGSSRYVVGSLIAYHNALKHHSLGVASSLLHRYGAVSAPVAHAMAEGIRRFAQTDVGLSITGIAGPTGATRTKPVGLVYIGWTDGERRGVLRAQCFGNREAIKGQAAQLVLDALRRFLLEKDRLGRTRTGRYTGGPRN